MYITKIINLRYIVLGSMEKCVYTLQVQLEVRKHTVITSILSIRRF